MTISWIRNDGSIISASSDDGTKPIDAVRGIFDGLGAPPRDTISGPAPGSGRQIWLGSTWSALPPIPPDSTVALDAAIDGAATLTALKAVLRGKVGAR